MKKQKEQNNELKTLCFNILYLRYKHKSSRREMAKILGVPLRTLKIMESKFIVPDSVDVEVLFRMNEYFGNKISDFFCFACGDYEKVNKSKEKTYYENIVLEK